MDESGDFLGFAVVTPVEIEFLQDEFVTRTMSGALPSTANYAVQMAISATLMADPLGDENMAGQLLSHWMTRKRSPFDWPGAFPQLPGHKRVAGDLTNEAAVAGATTVGVAGISADWKPGRVINAPGTTRLHLVTAVSANLLTIRPGLRVALSPGTLSGTAVPRVRYDIGYDPAVTVVRGHTVDKTVELVEA